MEQVFVIAKTSFVNGVVGSVNKKQRFAISRALAEEFYSMGLVEIEGGAVKKQEKSNQFLEAETDGQVAQSASSLVETVLPADSLPKPKQGRPKKAGS
jgi:hypothetical protein